MRFLLRNIFFLIFLGLVTCTMSVVYYVGYTEEGLRASINYAAKWVPGKLSIKAAHGKLFSNFTLEAITFDNGEQQIAIDSASLKWNPAGLLRDKFIIENLVLDHPTINLVSIESHKDPEKKTSFAWLKYIVLKQFVIKQLALKHADTTFNFDGVLTDEWQATWVANVPYLALFSADASGTIASHGSISGPLVLPIISAVIEGKNLTFQDKKMATLSGKINIDLHPNAPSTFALTASGINLNKAALNVLALKLDGQINREKTGMAAQLNLAVGHDYRATAQLTLPKFTAFTDLNQPLAGTIKIAISSLAILAQLSNDIKDPRGAIQSIVTLNGTLGKPTFSGNATLTNGHVTIPSLGISLEKLTLRAQHTGSPVINYQGNFQSGKGTGSIHGSIDLAAPNFPLALTLQGKALQIMHTRGYNISASPNLQLGFAKNILHITGDVFLDHAKIKLKNFTNTVTLPEEIIFVDQKDSPKTLPFETTMQLTLNLSDDIHFKYKNIVTDLRGRLQLLQNLYGSINATGELRVVKGTYNAYGQLLTIKDGRLIFTGGSLINPGLNIRAVKKISTIQMESATNSFGTATAANQPVPIYTGTEKATVGVQVMGTFENLKFSLFSIPGGMAQNDILSYLTLGRASGGSSKQLGGSLLKAASAINGDDNLKFNKFSKQLQNKFGLTELDVAATDTFDPTTGKVLSTTSVIVGKQLAPNLYAHFSKSIFDQVQTLNLRYKLSKHFAIQLETSTISNGSDLLYSIERD